MIPYFETYKILIVSATCAGLYFPAVERLYRTGWIKILKFFIFIPMLSIPMYFILAIKYVFFDKPDFLIQMYMSVQMIFTFFASFFVFSYHFYVKDLVRAFELWDSLFKGDLYPDARQEVLHKNKRISNGWLIIFGGMAVASSIFYSILPYFNPDKKLDHPLPASYRHQSPDFEMVVTWELFMVVFGCASLVTYDSITMALLSLEQAQFVHLKKSLARILENVTVTESGKIILTNNDSDGILEIHHDNMPEIDTLYPERVKNYDISWVVKNNNSEEEFKQILEQVEKKLILWITHHQQLLRFHDEIQRIYHIHLSMKYMMFVLAICWVAILLASGNILTVKDIIICIVFCVTNYTLFYVNIKFGDSIRDTSDYIFEDAFGSSWYIYPKKLRTMLMIITMRSNRPVQYFAWKIYPLSSPGFLKILTTAYSIFTFFMQVVNKKHIET